MSRSGTGLLVGSVTQAVGAGASLALQAAHFALLARWVTPRQFGAYVGALAVWSIAGALGEFGLMQSTVLALHRDGARPEAILRQARKASLVMGVASLLVAGAFTVVVLPRPVWTAAVALTPGFAIMRLATAPTAYRQSRLDVMRLALSDVAGRAVAVLALIPFVFTAGPSTFEARMLVAGGTMAVGLLVTYLARTIGIPKGPASPSPARELIWQAVPLGLTNAASFIHVRVDQVILAAFGLTATLAAYGVAYRVLDATLAVVTAIGVIGFAMLARSSLIERARVARELDDLMGLIGVVLGTTTFVFAPQIVAVIGGSGYPEAAWLARLLSPALLVSVLNIAPAQVAVAQNRSGALLRIAIGGVIANVVLNVILVPRFGARGAVAATVITETIGLVLVTRVAAKSLGLASNLHRLIIAGTGFGLATFVALLAWRVIHPIAGLMLGLAGLLTGLWPVRNGARRFLGQVCHGANGVPATVWGPFSE